MLKVKGYFRLLPAKTAVKHGLFYINDIPAIEQEAQKRAEAPPGKRQSSARRSYFLIPI
jgi:hypothetical protein